MACFTAICKINEKIFGSINKFRIFASSNIDNENDRHQQHQAVMPRTRHHNDGDSTANVPHGQAAAFAAFDRPAWQSEARLDRAAGQRDRVRHGRIALNAETEHHRMPVVWQNDNPKS